MSLNPQGDLPSKIESEMKKKLIKRLINKDMVMGKAIKDEIVEIIFLGIALSKLVKGMESKTSSLLPPHQSMGKTKGFRSRKKTSISNPSHLTERPNGPENSSAIPTIIFMG
jgi:hypothetical protein